MSQVSKNRLDGSIQRELYSQFYRVFYELKEKKEMEEFLSEFLTKTEKTMLSKRLMTAFLLTRGYSYRDIRFLLHVSFPTIRSVQFWLDHGRGGYKKAVEKIAESQAIRSFLEKIDKTLDSHF